MGMSNSGNGDIVAPKSPQEKLILSTKTIKDNSLIITTCKLEWDTLSQNYDDAISLSLLPQHYPYIPIMNIC